LVVRMSTNVLAILDSTVVTIALMGVVMSIWYDM